MGVFFDEPKYPVIDKAPKFWKTVGNYSLRDYGTVALFTGFSVPFGYWSGIKAGVPRQSAITCGLIGLTAGVMYAYQNSAGRLMGLKPNDGEVEAGLAKR